MRRIPCARLRSPVCIVGRYGQLRMGLNDMLLPLNPILSRPRFAIRKLFDAVAQNCTYGAKDIFCRGQCDAADDENVSAAHCNVQALSSACERSAMMSLASSIPTEMRTSPSVRPLA